MTDYYRLWQIITVYDRFLQIMTDYNRLWQIMTDHDRLWHIMTDNDILLHIGRVGLFSYACPRKGFSSNVTVNLIIREKDRKS